MSIPKKIHYCWFGGAPFDEKTRRCMETWQKFCPDFEIIRWDESNSPLDDNDYVRQAYEQKKWAFVSDYVRLVALCGQGGIYLDTDVELVAPLDDFLSCEGVLGFESGEHIATCLMAAVPGQRFFREERESYHGQSFVKEDGSFDETTNVRRVTEHLARYGLQKNNERQEVCGIQIYPSDVFSPKSLETGRICVTANTCAIHHFSASWMTPRQRFNTRVAQLLGPGLTRGIKRILKKLRG